MKSEKKKQGGTQWIFVISYMLIGAGCGLLIMNYLEHIKAAGVPVSGRIVRLIVLFLCMYGALLVQIIIHEAGHLVFGLATGYCFNSFRIMNFMWMKDNGAIRFKRMSLAGTGGQCLMDPPDLKDGKMPVMLYNFGGAAMNVIASLVFGGIALLCPSWSFGWIILMFLVIIGFADALMNGIPLGSGTVNNDGTNALDLSRSPEAMRAFWIQLKANEMISKGVRTKDMPEEWFQMPSDEAMKNGIIAILGVLRCSRLMDEKRFEEADELMSRLLSQENGVVGLHRSLLTCDRAFVELIGQNRRDILDGMLTKEQKKMMKAMKQYPSVLRTEYAYALLCEKDPAKAEEIMKQFEKTAETYPYPCEIQGERELMGLAAVQLRAISSEDQPRTGVLDG